MDPQDVQSSNFTNHVVLYNDKNFSIAIGNWEGDENDPRVGMRWNTADSNIGYPNTRGNPKWFIVENHVALPLLAWLLEKNKRQYTSIKRVMKQML